MTDPHPSRLDDDRESEILREAALISGLFGEGAEDVIERLIANALDDLAVDRAMFLLDVQSALYGLPIGHFSPADRDGVRASAELAEIKAAVARGLNLSILNLSSELSRRRARRAAR